MIFEKYRYIYLIIACGIVTAFLFYYHSKIASKLVYRIWRHKASKSYKLSNILFVLGLASLFIVLLDPRKKIEQREVEISNQYTILLIDTSTSMAVEDLRPNRFQKAVMLARHFVKSASGHYISVILFSDGHKIVMPFTDDVDFIDTRLSAIADSAELKGSSNINQAIQESINYLSAELGRRSDLVGNLVIFSDFEEQDASFDLRNYEKLSVAAVGVATASGGPIPIRDNNRVFRGHKKHEGEIIQSKLSEEGLKRILKHFRNSKYWITMNYNIPTDEILAFFRANYVKSLDKGNVDLRPLDAKKFWLTGLLLVIASMLLRFKPAFLAIIYMQISLGSEVFTPDEYANMSTEKRLQKSLEIIMSASPDKPEFKKGVTIYSENLNNESSREEKMNLLFSHLKSGDFKNFSQDSKKYKIETSNDPKLRENILLALQAKSQQQKDGKGDSDEEKKSESDSSNSDKEQQSSDSKGQQNKDKKGKGSQSDEDDKENKDDKGKSKENENKEDQNKDDKNESGEQKQTEITANKIKQREDEISKKLKQANMPGILKQLIEDDRKLQSMYLDTSSEKGNENDQKDW